MLPRTPLNTPLTGVIGFDVFVQLVVVHSLLDQANFLIFSNFRLSSLELHILCRLHTRLLKLSSLLGTSKHPTGEHCILLGPKVDLDPLSVWHVIDIINVNTQYASDQEIDYCSSLHAKTGKERERDK